MNQYHRVKPTPLSILSRSETRLKIHNLLVVDWPAPLKSWVGKNLSDMPMMSWVRCIFKQQTFSLGGSLSYPWTCKFKCSWECMNILGYSWMIEWMLNNIASIIQLKMHIWGKGRARTVSPKSGQTILSAQIAGICWSGSHPQKNSLGSRKSGPRTTVTRLRQLMYTPTW